MCNYWTKKYLCGCDSHIFRERCQVALRDENACDAMEREEAPRKSYFPCYTCLKAEVEAEKKQKIQDAEQAEMARRKAEEQMKKEAEKARQAQIRKDAEVRAQREREDEMRRERDRKAEVERAKREGGLWMDAGSHRKGRGKKPHGGGSVRGMFDNSLPPSPVSAPPAFGSFKRETGVYGPLTAKEPMMGPMGSMGAPNVNTPVIMETQPAPAPVATTVVDTAAPLATRPKTDLRLPPKPDFGPNNKVVPPAPTSAPMDKGVDPGGRAGRWGPKSSTSGQQSKENYSPKKILKNDHRANGHGKKA